MSSATASTPPSTTSSRTSTPSQGPVTPTKTVATNLPETPPPNSAHSKAHPQLASTTAPTSTSNTRASSTPHSASLSSTLSTSPSTHAPSLPSPAPPTPATSRRSPRSDRARTAPFTLKAGTTNGSQLRRRNASAPLDENTSSALASSASNPGSESGSGSGVTSGFGSSPPPARATSSRISNSTRQRFATDTSALTSDNDNYPGNDSDSHSAHHDTMLSGKTGLRGRNMEDIGDLEEQGLLMRREVSSGSASGTPRHRHGSDKDISSPQFEKIEFDDAEKVTGAGLKSKRDQQAFALLVVLYLLQGIPLGLTFGTLPFMLKPHLSYSALAVFALSTWPYSLKLLWSPIVDAWFVPKWGRRKSWIVPVQAIVGLGLWIIGGRVENWIAKDNIDINFITMVFGSLIFAAATQDIAVDGWALTLLSPPNLSYASTAQTIGLGIGTALSFTVFLALNSVDFTNKYFRSTPGLTPLIQLGPYIRFWGVMYIAVTIWLIFFKKEDPVSADDPDLDVGKVYKVMWSIIRLKNIQSFLFILLIAKFGFQVNESVTQLKLLEKGLSKEDLAVAVLLDFPAQMIVGWLAAKWSRPAPPTGDEGRHPLSATNTRAAAAVGVLRVWVGAFWARLAMATIAATVVYNFPTGNISSSYFMLVVCTTLMTSLTNTVQFVGITAFHTQIADPLIGGTYMTLLNTVSNLGGTWPKPIILRAVDLLTVSHCSATGTECTSEAGKHACSAVNGQCIITRDGYYVMDAICVVLSATLLMVHILPSIKRLQTLPMSAWRVKIPT